MRKPASVLFLALSLGCASGAVLEPATGCASDDGCDPGDVCTLGACGPAALGRDAFTVTPPAATVDASAGTAPPAASFRLDDSTKTGHTFSVRCGAGATATPASGKVKLGSSATVSVQAAAPAQAGTNRLACAISSNVRSDAATFQLTVVAAGPGGAPDFALAATPAALAIAPGAQAVADLAVDATGGFGGAVALSVAGAPAGWSASISPASVAPGAAARLTVGLPASATGAATLVISGRSGGLAHTLALPVTASSSGGGPIGPGGGSVDLLDFVIEGDTRPPACNQTQSYPTAIHAQIVKAMAALNPQFGLDLGDHMYACAQDAQAAQQQMGLYVQGLQGFPAPFFMTMGNHECENGADCSANRSDVNFAAYSAALLQVSKQSLPYYALQIQTRLGRATVVSISDNYFDATAQAWFEATLADADRNSIVTIIAKHHPVTGSRTGPQGPLQVLQSHKYSLILTAHNHDYSHDTASFGGRSVVCGLGGANTAHTGFCRVQQSADGQLHFTQYDATGTPGDAWAVGPR